MNILSAICSLFKNKAKTLENKTNIHCVIVIDEYYDELMDNDDADDIPTLVKVFFNDNGEILSVSEENGQVKLSSAQEIEKFKRICQISDIESKKKYSLLNSRGVKM